MNTTLTPAEIESGLERLSRDSEFMKPFITRRQQWLKLDGTHGVVYIPRNDLLAATVMDLPAECPSSVELDADTLNALFGDYYEGTIESAEVVKGYGARLSAPGYLDCTEWGVFATEDEAKAYLVETYADDYADEDAGDNDATSGDPMTRDIIRTCIFRPYRHSQGPWFSLTVWDTGKRHPRGTTDLGYRLEQSSKGQPREVIFEGDGFSPSPMEADDSDASMKALMSFLTLRPGDTDSEYFENYTPRQMEFAQQHAETLALCVGDRWGWD